MECQNSSRELDETAAEREDNREGTGDNMAPPKEKAAKKPKGPRKRTVCKSEDIGLLIDYLEEKENYQKLFNSQRKTSATGKNISKEAVWDIVVAELKGQGFPKTTGKNLQKKWYRLFQKFRDAKQLSKQTGGGLTENKLEEGMTLEDKLNSICEHFYRLDALIGNRANVEAPAESGPMGFQNFEADAIPSQTTATPPPAADCNPAIPAATAISDVDEEDEFQDEGEEGALPDQPEERNQQPSTPQQPPPQTVGKDPSNVGATERQGAAEGRGAAGPTKQATTNQGSGGKKGAPGSGSGKGKKPAGDKAEHDKKSSSMTSKPNLATVFQESKAMETEFKMRYMQSKEEWKLAEIRDRRDAREDEYKRRMMEREEDFKRMAMEKEDALKRRKLEIDFDIEKREYDVEQKKIDRSEVAYQASMERSHHLEASKQANLFNLAIALVNKDKSIDDIKNVYSLFDK